jgi:Tfp pilus assembly protein PilO
MRVLSQLQWSKLSKRERILFVSTLIALLYSFIFFFLQPRMAERRRLDEQKRTLQQEISALSSTLPVLMRQAEAAVNPSEPAPALVLSDTSLSAILEELSRQARIKEVQLVELKPSPAEKKEGYEILPIQIKSRSRFFNLGDYIFSLERLPRPIIIEHLKIESTTETSPDVNAEMLLQVYKGGGA